MLLMTRLHLLFERWKDRWISPLEYDETALGIEPFPLQSTYQIWVSIRGRKLFWLSGHRTCAGAEGALVEVIAWARRLEQMDLVTHTAAMTLLVGKGDFRAHPPSERIEDEIRQRIRRRDPSVLIVRAAPVGDNEAERFSMPDGTWNGVRPDAQTMELLRTTNQFKVWLQLQARSWPRVPRVHRSGRPGSHREL